MKWLNLEGANWCGEKKIEGKKVMELATPYVGEWIALLKKTSLIYYKWRMVVFCVEILEL